MEISSLLNSSSNTTNEDDVCKSFKNRWFNQGMYVSVTEVMELLRELSSGKASGMDGLTRESLKYMQIRFYQFYYLSVLLACLNTVTSQLVCLIQLQFLL